MKDNEIPNLKDMYHYVVDCAEDQKHLPFKKRFQRVVHTKVFKDVEYLFLCRAKAMLAVPISIFVFATFMKIFFSHIDSETNQKISVFLIIYVIIALVVSWRLGTRHALQKIQQNRQNKVS